MSKPGARKLDLITSLTAGDIHILIVPPGVPTPIPHPVPASIIKDKVVNSVKVMGQPGAVKGSKSKHTPPHIPQGGSFTKPPMNQGEVFITTSVNVLYEGKNAAVLGDTAMMCCDPVDLPIGKVMGTAATVLVAATGVGTGDEARAAAYDAAMAAAAKKAHEWIDANMPPGADREQAHRNVCAATGHPIDVVTGKMFTRNVDVQLDGRMPVGFVRNYSSARTDRGPFGHSWRHSFQRELIVHREFVAYRDENGRFLSFAPIDLGGRATNPLAQLTLERTKLGYEVVDSEGRLDFFAYQGVASGTALVVPLTYAADKYGNQIRLSYADHKLVRIADPVGRVLELSYNRRGLVESLKFVPRRDSTEGEVVRRYRYSDADDLVEWQDEIGNAYKYEYSRHLLVREINRNGFSFYFTYDALGWCQETWGDGGIFYRRLDYDTANRRTRVTNSLGEVTTYKWAPTGVVETETDHHGHTWRFEFNEALQRTRTEDPVGNVWTTEYDASGRPIASQSPEGATTANEWRSDGSLLHTDAHGGTWLQEHDAAKGETRITGPSGRVRTKIRQANGDVRAIRYDDGKEVAFAYDPNGNVASVRLPTGLQLSRRYSPRGLLVAESDQLGPRLTLEYDARGKPIKRWDRHKGESRLEWDAEGRLKRATDALGRTTEYEYGNYDRIVAIRRPSVRLADGSLFQPAKRFQYDTENRLTAVTTPSGETTRMHYQDRARPMRIEYPDGRVQVYERDARDYITGFYESDVAVFRQRLDSEGRVLHRVTGDGESFSFEYDGMGNLVAAETTRVGDTPVRLQYDAVNRVLLEEGGGGTQAFTYLHGSEHVRTRWAEDLELECRWSSTPHGPRWTATLGDQGAIEIGYDQRMRMTSAAFPSGEQQCFSYEEADEPIARTLLEVSGKSIQEGYEYDDQGWLVRCRIAGGRSRRFTRDEWNRLIGVNDDTTGRFEERTWGFDAHGNRVRSTSSAGAPVVNRYGEGNQIVRVDGAPVSYDERGRVVAMRTDDGVPLRLDWDVLGRLRKVTLADGATVTMQYDALGRRVAKTSASGTTTFGWVGDRMVHETRADGEERHYVYHRGSHRPLACLIRKPGDDWKSHAFVTDSRGAAVRLADEKGEVVWIDDGDAWGLRRGEAREFDQPITLAGHYRDEETGLHYNYARYYAPLTGCYLSPDPIGLEGGDNPYAYVADPICWADPLGLSGDDSCGTTEAEKTEYIYRGVSANHPEIEAARRGSCVPGDVNGTVTPEEHNEGGHADKSPYTAWTHDENYARTHANKDGPGGVVLRVPVGAPKEGDGWSWEWSPDEWGESEVLLKGRRDNCEVLDP